MYICRICNYSTTIKHNFNVHMKGKKHIELEEKFLNNENKKERITHEFICKKCNKTYEHSSSLSRHTKNCFLIKNNKDFDNTNNNDIGDKMYYKLEKDMIEKEYQYKLEIQKLEFEKQLKDKENQLLKLQINTNNNITNNTNNSNNIINNNVKISKIQYLNLNFQNVIDINTFLKNYNDSYGLTSDQTKILLENSENDGVTACISGIIHYLKKSAVKQYKDIKGEDIAMENIILPFLLSDKCVRDHFEKSSDNNWDKTTMIDNIQKIISITNNQVFKHHNKYMNFNVSQRKRIINGLLKQSGYNMVSKIANQDFYKKKKKDEDNKSISSSESKDDIIIIQCKQEEEEEEEEEDYHEEEYYQEEEDYDDEEEDYHE